MKLGRVGIWRSLMRGGADAAKAIEGFGYDALWVGSSPSVDQTRPYLEASSTIPVITAVLNIWQHTPAEVAAACARIAVDHPGRFLLGMGVGHPEFTSGYGRPLKMMSDFLDGLDAAETPVPREQRIVAALGPRMLELGKERALGAHSYFTTVEHTRYARERVGEGVLIAPEVAVVVESDPELGRAKAREFAQLHLGLSNYTRNVLKFGFTENDLDAGGSDRLIDAVIPHGTPERIADVVHAHLDAGADHVCLQVLGSDEPTEDYGALAAVLL
jgi:probable F420-dependent oxidoreductase